MLVRKQEDIGKLNQHKKQQEEKVGSMRPHACLITHIANLYALVHGASE